jgi:demethylmenaquinone methyltransferase / 2-methoxy-6-polyprenyl-1,4-benzoquinol methylase
LASSYDRAGALLSLGLEAGWRRRLVDAVPARPSQSVVDVASGTGLVARALATRHGCRVTGVDQSREMLEVARRRTLDMPLAHLIDYVEASAERLPFEDASFDHLTVTYLLRYVDDPDATLRELVRVIRPGGTFASLEFGLPPRGPLRWGWWMHTRWLLPLVGRVVSPDWAEAARFLHRSIPDFYRRLPLDALLAAHRAAGLTEIRTQRPALGSALIITGRRP